MVVGEGRLPRREGEAMGVAKVKDCVQETPKVKEWRWS